MDFSFEIVMLYLSKVDIMICVFDVGYDVLFYFVLILDLEINVRCVVNCVILGGYDVFCD